jgi:S1-C subfamily serine protease
MPKFLLHRVDGRIAGPFVVGHLLQLCSEGRAFEDESIARDSDPSRLRRLSEVSQLAEPLASGRAVRSSRVAMAVSAVSSDLRRAVVQIRTPTGSGTGFAIDEAGLILTNRHVVDDSSTCTVHFSNGAISPGTVIFRSDQADLAVVCVALPTPDFICLSERRGDLVAVGEPVVALGFPQDAGFNVTQGIIGALGVRFSPSDSESHSRHEWIRTSAEINGGNSGGPLVDLHGSLVGVATWGQVFDGRGAPVAGMNYCIPHAVVCRELREFRQLVREGKIRVPHADEIQRVSQQPDAWDELDLAVSLICSRYRMRVTKKVPIPDRGSGFHRVELASSVGDVINILVDSFVFKDGPMYLTMYCEVGDLSDAILKDSQSLAGLLRHNMRLPHWNLALRDDQLVLRLSRELHLINAAEIMNAVQDLTIILRQLASKD